jgi:hypothetical protein
MPAPTIDLPMSAVVAVASATVGDPLVVLPASVRVTCVIGLTVPWWTDAPPPLPFNAPIPPPEPTGFAWAIVSPW